MIQLTHTLSTPFADRIHPSACSISAIPSPSPHPSGERADAGAATTYAPGSIVTNAGGPSGGLLGLPGSLVAGWQSSPSRSRSAPAEALPVQALGQPGTVVPRLRGALILE